MPIANLDQFQEEGYGDDGRPDGEKLPPFGPGGIYHEKQIGNLCAVHALNNLLQSPIYDPIILSEVALQLDTQERQLLGGESFSEGNVRMDGFFNVEVIKLVLQNAGFTVDRISSEGQVKEPSKHRGFIFNRKEHWFAFRRIGNEWFDLNSCILVPKHFTDPELAAHINEALTEGYDVFSVHGPYPACELEKDSKKLLEAVRGCGRADAKMCLYAGQGHTLSGAPAGPSITAAMAEEDPELAAAIAASLADSKPAAPAAESMDEIRRKRLARFG